MMTRSKTDRLLLIYLFFFSSYHLVNSHIEVYITVEFLFIFSLSTFLDKTKMRDFIWIKSLGDR